MMICDNCEKKFDCVEPCKRAVNWKPLKEECYNRDYKPIGIAPYNPWSEQSEIQRRKRWGTR